MGLVTSRAPFPDLKDVMIVNGMKCAVMEVDGKTVLICGTEFGYHIWVAKMSPEALGELAHKFPKGASTPEALRFVVSPMG